MEMKTHIPQRLLGLTAAFVLALALLPPLDTAPAHAAQPGPALTVAFRDDAGGGNSLQDNPMKTAVESALAAKIAAEPGVTTGDIVKIELTGAADKITGENWNYLRGLLFNDSSTQTWDSLHTLDLRGLTGLRELSGTRNLWTKQRPGEVLLPDGLETIGDYAFYAHPDLTGIVFPSNLKTIGYGAFAACGLADVALPDGLQAIGASAFENCTSLSSLDLPDSLQTIGDSAFFGCTSLSSLTLPSNLQAIGNRVFEGCASLSSLTLPSNLQAIGDLAFFGCSSLASFTLPVGLRSIGDSAFDNCMSLETVWFLGTDAPALGSSLVFWGASPSLALWVPANGRGYLGASASPEWRSLAGFVRTYSTAPAYTPAPSAYALAVENGEGGGWYRADSQITLKAVPPAAGAVFLRWELTAGHGELADPAAPETVFTMSIGDAAVRAVFELPAPEDPREQPTASPQTGDPGSSSLPCLLTAGAATLLLLRRLLNRA